MKDFSLKRTKIVATLGPATSDLQTIKELIIAGVNVFRLNFSHGTAEEHRQRANYIREAMKTLHTQVGIIADLQGPKIRIGAFKAGKIELRQGQTFILDADFDLDQGDQTQVGIAYKNLPKDVQSGDQLLLDDGRVVFTVEKIEDNKIYCKVKAGTVLSSHKGINKFGGGLSAEALTEKDKADLLTAISIEADYIAISFPRNAADMHYARKLMHAAGGNAGLIAKIERAEAMQATDEIINASDAVMVARGDLGVEIGDAALPAAQKHIIQRARALNKAVITATQMMESMIENNIPTRAEVFDVANAVLDYTDAVMLSAETATGKHPVEVVKAMARICIGAENQPGAITSKHRVECFFEKNDEAIAMAAIYAANHSSVKAVISLTASGDTPLQMSRLKTGIPIFAFSEKEKTLRKICLYRDVYPIPFSLENKDHNNIYDAMVVTLKQHDLVASGDNVLITCGDFVGKRGSTNTLKMMVVA